MLSLEQVKILEKKVEHAIAIIKRLSSECDSLKVQIIEKDERITELENMVIAFKDDQTKIESGIKNTLSLLNSLEDLAALPSKQETASPAVVTHESQKQKDLAQILGNPAGVPQSSSQPDIF